jgi:hypothetical protein
MIIEFCKDTNKRKCCICKTNIKKGDILVKYEKIIDSWKNTRMWFAHLDCLIKKLLLEKDKMKNIIPKYKVEINN